MASKIIGNKSMKQKSDKINLKAKFQWNQCAKCGLILPKHFNEEHECFDIDKSILSNHAFIFNDFSILNAVEHTKGFSFYYLEIHLNQKIFNLSYFSRINQRSTTGKRLFVRFCIFKSFYNEIS